MHKEKFLAENMAIMAEQYAVGILNALEQDGSEAVFEEFIYWTADEEGGNSHGRCCHSDAPYNISLVVNQNKILSKV